jgi:hypothetical protein
MGKTVLHTMTAADPAVIKMVLNPTEYGIIMPQGIGFSYGMTVTFAGWTLSLMGVTFGALDPYQFAGVAASSLTAGIAIGSMKKAMLGREAMLFLANAAMKREEWEQDDGEEEPWTEPERPPFMPSFVQDAVGYHRVLHDLARRELLMLNGHAEVGARFPTRELLFSKGFTNNAQRFKELRSELHKKGILMDNIWTGMGVAWVRDEAHRATSPTPR